MQRERFQGETDVHVCADPFARLIDALDHANGFLGRNAEFDILYEGVFVVIFTTRHTRLRQEK